MSYKVKFRLHDWLSFEHWESEGVTHIKLIEDRNPREVGSLPKIVLDAREISAEIEIKGLQR